MKGKIKNLDKNTKHTTLTNIISWLKIVLPFSLTGIICWCLLYFKASPDLWGTLAGAGTFAVLLLAGISIGNAVVRETAEKMARDSQPI
ncbi:MAG: hypothetical protein GY810_20935 [Aureispira sp.]|nr:hypothetical protein [Aureispira sp.]